MVALPVVEDRRIGSGPIIAEVGVCEAVVVFEPEAEQAVHAYVSQPDQG